MAYASAIPVQEIEAFDAAGPPGAPPVVLVHGSVVSRKMWLPQLRALSSEYRVIAPDLPGHGALARLPFRLETAVQTLKYIVDTQADGCALLVGLSMGGYAGIAFAARYPQSVSGLVISGASLNFTGALGVYMKATGYLMSRLMDERRLNRSAEARVRAMYPPELTEAAEAQLAAGLYSRAAGQSFLELAGVDFRRMLSAYPGPVLILNGEHDRQNRKGEAAFAAAAANAAVRFVPGAGHSCSTQQPGAYTEAVLDFARRIGW